jgi:hypothetical protein
MAGLTAKQEGFIVDHVVKGMTLSDSYRKNYNTENMTSKTVNEEASRLYSDPKLAARRAELQESNKKLLEVTVESQIAEYRELMAEARLLLTEEGGKTPQSIDLRIKTLARIDKICGLEQNNHDITTNGESIQNEWHIHPTTAKDA